ncbi:ligase-associated DNA damage response endonuclease PdeM [Aurantibacter crassamenti]|uniref:ligase-associated DNA damage response endonuclease PdeM n=1 Tax=Aurantibacter crassamenti TaxID=1837375 RepID=UPI00193ABA21|nr:ligase-associated DNA damage response endonuclease PdeM [Aurantibacter crassamenti]MBM1105556.1 ligase-associated DNA damage response endonuclease PdeM [Aurantibacter crassamenti]
MSTKSIQIRNQNFIMHYSGALYWNEKSSLLISDVHLGKISHFRKFGAAVPQAAIHKNFQTMDTAIDFFKPKTLIFMGDLFHSSLNNEWDIFEDWVRLIAAEIILISGNHDIISPLKYEALGIKVISELILDTFLLTHHPEERDELFNFSGHIHPAIRLSGVGRQTVRLPCFYKTKSQIILPAFGEFTGSHTMHPIEECEIFALLGDAVLPVPIKEVKQKRYFRNS